MNANTPVTQELTRNEWYAIIHALRHTGAVYLSEHGGVDLLSLADRLAKTILDLETSND